MAKDEWLTFEHFAGRIGERFDAAGEDSNVQLELVEATEGCQPGGRGPEGQERLQFSLVFRGPATEVLAQGTYPLSHAELGELMLFLVPIAQDTDGMRYEAAFA